MSDNEFGLAYLRIEGGYLHPDDTACSTPDRWTHEEYQLWYDIQLKLYEGQFKDE